MPAPTRGWWGSGAGERCGREARWRARNRAPPTRRTPRAHPAARLGQTVEAVPRCRHLVADAGPSEERVMVSSRRRFRPGPGERRQHRDGRRAAQAGRRGSRGHAGTPTSPACRRCRCSSSCTSWWRTVPPTAVLNAAAMSSGVGASPASSMRCPGERVGRGEDRGGELAQWGVPSCSADGPVAGKIEHPLADPDLRRGRCRSRWPRMITSPAASSRSMTAFVEVRRARVSSSACHGTEDQVGTDMTGGGGSVRALVGRAVLTRRAWSSRTHRLRPSLRPGTRGP